MDATSTFIPLFPPAELIAEPIDFINRTLSKVDRKIPDARYSYELAIEFLEENKHNTNNYRSIRKEINGLFNWCFFVAKIPLTDLNRVTMRQFVDYCNKPPLQEISTAPYAAFVQDATTDEWLPNPKWRQFTAREPAKYLRKEVTLKAQLSILSSFFIFLDDMDFCTKNPAATLLRRLNINNTRVAESEETEKSLSDTQWRTVWDLLVEKSEKEKDNEDDNLKYHRSRFLFAMLRDLYCRVSEFAARPGYTPLMNSFELHRSGSWVFYVPRSKGGKSRHIPCPQSLIEELKIYRRAIGLSDLPTANDENPLFVRHKAASHGREAGIRNAQLGMRQIRVIVKEVYNEAAETLEPLDSYAAKELRNFSVHSMRHTGIQSQINDGMPLNVLMRNTGHSDLSSLSDYAGANLSKQIEETKNRD
ncbi:tyrosine-type recombinase/integrase [Vibrio breoganii]